MRVKAAFTDVELFTVSLRSQPTAVGIPVDSSMQTLSILASDTSTQTTQRCEGGSQTESINSMHSGEGKEAEGDGDSGDSRAAESKSNGAGGRRGSSGASSAGLPEAMRRLGPMVMNELAAAPSTAFEGWPHSSRFP